MISQPWLFLVCIFKSGHHQPSNYALKSDPQNSNLNLKLSPLYHSSTDLIDGFLGIRSAI